MAGSYASDAPPRPVSALEHPDSRRYAFWRTRAMPIRASLLRITGWLEEEPDREVPVVEHDHGDGRTRARWTREPSPTDSVLFRLDRPGTRERADWEAYFVWVRTLQDHGRLVQQKSAAAQAKIDEIDGRLAALRSEWDAAAEQAEKDHAEFQRTVSELKEALKPPTAGLSATHAVAVPAGALGLPGDSPVLVDVEGPLQAAAPPRTPTEEQLRRIEATRKGGLALVSAWESKRKALERRFERLHAERKPFELELKRLELESTRRVYAGLFSRINAFLDVQALSTASVAIEEFRKTPRRESAVIEEMEARLATD